MSIQQLPLPSGDGTGNRDLVAAEVRAALARVKIPASRVADFLGGTTSRAYWSRRVNGQTSMDIDDLSAIAAITGTSIGELVRTTQTPPSPPRSGGGAGRRNIVYLEVGPAGIEPTTSTVEAPRLEDDDRPLAPVIPITRGRDISAVSHNAGEPRARRHSSESSTDFDAHASA